MSITLMSRAKSFGGWQQQFSHVSASLKCTMRFAIYLPPQAEQGQQVPVLFWLSGLTCTDENFMQKAGALRVAAELGIALVAPDTSPRGDTVADDVEGAYDLGLGAGFYLNATQDPWRNNYQMYTYITEELPQLIAMHFPVGTKRGISGHSMGGHGALTIGLKNPQLFNSISAFSPICHPLDCPWGQKALRAYLGEDKSTWVEYDTVEIIKNLARSSRAGAELTRQPILIDQGDQDAFLATQLRTDVLQQTISECGDNLPAYQFTIRMQAGYDHSYYFVSTFIEEHLRFHAEQLLTA